MRANVQCAILSGQFHIIAWKISIPVGSLVSSLGICTGKLLASFWGTYRYSQSYYRYLIILEKTTPVFCHVEEFTYLSVTKKKGASQTYDAPSSLYKSLSISKVIHIYIYYVYRSVLFLLAQANRMAHVSHFWN